MTMREIVGEEELDGMGGGETLVRVNCMREKFIFNKK